MQVQLLDGMLPKCEACALGVVRSRQEAELQLTGLGAAHGLLALVLFHSERQASHSNVLSVLGSPKSRLAWGWRLCNSIHSNQQGSVDGAMSFCVSVRERVTSFVAQGGGLAIKYLDFIKEFNNTFHRILVFKGCYLTN